jgi:hypothetical protein
MAPMRLNVTPAFPRRLLAVVGAASMVAVLAACGSSSSDASSATTVTTSGGSGTTTPCPFDGTTDPKSLPSSGSGNTTLTTTEGQAQGCIDQFRMSFKNGVPVVTAAYSDPAYPDHLVVNFGALPTTGSPANIVNYTGDTNIKVPSGFTNVDSISVQTSSNGIVTETFDLKSKMNFDVSSSQVPAVVIVSVA